MWVFLSKRLRLWVLLAVGAPLASWLLGTVGERLEKRSGPTPVSKLLKTGHRWVQRRARGPLAHRTTT